MEYPDECFPVIKLTRLQSYGQTTKMPLDTFRQDCGIKGSIVGILNNNLLLSFGLSQLHRSRPLLGLRFSAPCVAQK